MDDRVHSKLIHCLQSWVSRFGADGSLVGVQRVYERLMNGQTRGGETRGGGAGLRRRGTTGSRFYKPVGNPHQRVRYLFFLFSVCVYTSVETRKGSTRGEKGRK